MAAKKSYNRFFIIFQEEDKGYGTGPDRPPTGYVKVETKSDKSKITVYVQNVKPFENGECLYKCFLISHQDEKDSVAYLGIMDIDELGRGESSWESSAENAFDTKTSIDKFNAAAIVAEREGMGVIVAPLAGYMSKEKFEWRSKIPLQKHNEVKETVQEVKEEKITCEEPYEEAAKFEEYEKQISEMVSSKDGLRPAKGVKEPVSEEIDVSEDRSETKEIKIPEDESETDNRDINNTDDSKNEDYEEYVDNDFEEEDDEIRNKHKHDNKYCEHKCEEYKYDKKDYKNYDDDYNEYMGYSKYDCRNMMKKLLEDILEEYEEVDMHKELKDCRMWKVDMNKYRKDKNKIYKYPCYDLIFYPMLNNPYCNYYHYIRRHGHYLFGIEYDRKRQAGRALRRLVFGIPGSNNIFDQPFQGLTGFTTWIPSSSKSTEGYWIMMYDPMTGMVSQPE